jgi:hypothetical protein
VSGLLKWLRFRAAVSISRPSTRSLPCADSAPHRPAPASRLRSWKRPAGRAREGSERRARGARRGGRQDSAKDPTLLVRLGAEPTSLNRSAYAHATGLITYRWARRSASRAVERPGSIGNASARNSATRSATRPGRQDALPGRHGSRWGGSMSRHATSVATGITERARGTPSAASVRAHASPSTTAPMNRTVRPRLDVRFKRSRIIRTDNLGVGHLS